MNKPGRRTVMLISFILLGLIAAMQCRSVLNKNQLKAANALDTAKLTTRIESEQKLEKRLKTDIATLNASIESYFRSSLEQKNDDESLNEYERLKLEAGLTDVEGPGITMKLDDAAARADNDWNDRSIIHDKDIKVILNDLKIAGAQAISINGERIVAISEVYCAGPTIIINGNRCPVPYIITAIGNQDSLFDYMSKSERVMLMLNDKIRIDIRKSNKITVPKYSASDNIEKFIDKLEVSK